MARGPRWVPVRPVAVPSQGAPPMATSIWPARRSAGVRQSGSLAKVWIPLQLISLARLTVIGPGSRGVGSGIDPRIRDGLQDVDDRVDRDVSDAQQEGHAGYGGEVGGRDALRHV